MFRLKSVRPLAARARGLGLASMVMVVVLCALGVSTAVATPTGEYAVFVQCPTHTAHVDGCLILHIESGEFKIGNEPVPIPSVLQGGLFSEEEEYIKHMAPALNGETLARPTPHEASGPFRGGLAGLVRCDEITNFGERVACNASFEHGMTQVDAVTEVAGPASSIILNTAAAAVREGTALLLPVKIKLENPLLGNECYIGSETEPIVLEMTTGTTNPPPPNTPITGNYGELTTKDKGGILVDSDHSLVDDSFAVPAATGCGGAFSSVVDPILNARLGLPSAAGHNTAIFTGTSEIANSELVEYSGSNETTTPPPPPPPRHPWPPRHSWPWGSGHTGGHPDHWSRNGR